MKENLFLIQPYYFGEGIRIFLREKSCYFKNGLPCTKVQSPRTAHSGRTVDFTLKYIIVKDEGGIRIFLKGALFSFGN